MNLRTTTRVSWEYGIGDRHHKASTFNCRVVFVDKVRLDQLDGQARFAYTASTDNDQLVFSQELLHQKEKREPVSIARNC